MALLRLAVNRLSLGSTFLNLMHGMAFADGDGYTDVLYEDGRFVSYLQNNGATPPSESYTKQSLFTTTIHDGQYLTLGDGDGDGDLDIVIPDWDTSAVVWHENLVCHDGTASPSGSEPCVVCPAGTFAIGYGNTVCTPCPAGQFNAAAGAIACSGTCAASAGSACLAGATSATGTPCPAGTYANATGATACIPCPAGRYGAATSSGEASSSCSGACVAPPGSGCDAGVTAPTGRVCPPGFYSPGGPSPCQPCASGVYGSSPGSTTSACDGGGGGGGGGQCIALPGQWCPPGATAATASVLCPLGRYSIGGVGVAACSLCPAGTLGSTQELTSSVCGGPCPIGRYADVAGASDCSACPAGRYGSTTGATSPYCSGRCVAAVPGRYCPAGATTSTLLCPAGRYSSAADATTCEPCAAGRYGAPGANSSDCTAGCDAGTYSPPGSSVCTACPPGQYSLEGAGACVLCPAGVWASSQGSVSSDCGGYCTPSPGRYCPEGATSPNPLPCPPGTYSVAGDYGQCRTACGTVPTPGRYCPAANDSATPPMPQPCPVGLYSSAVGQSACVKCAQGHVGTTMGQTSPSCSGQCPGGRYAALGQAACVLCPAGQYAVAGSSLGCVACPSGRYGATTGLATSACSGACVAGPGRYCAVGMTRADGWPCAAGTYSVTGDSSSACTPCRFDDDVWELVWVCWLLVGVAVVVSIPVRVDVAVAVAVAVAYVVCWCCWSVEAEAGFRRSCVAPSAVSAGQLWGGGWFGVDL